MTFSIVAHCPRSGKFGVAAATGANAVGQLVSHASAHTGAIATQAWTNPYIGYDGLRLLHRGYTAHAALEKLIANDPNPQIRQAAIIDRWGNTAAWTGSDTLDWKGDRQGRNFSTQGNRLAGPHVLDAVVESMHASEDKDLAERLLIAIEIGDALGGDTKDERSVNLVVFDREEYPQWDIRVDDHDHPVKELRRLFHLFQDEWLSHIEKMTNRAEFPKLVD